MKYSVGEQLVAKILKENKVNFDYNVSLDDLKGVKNGILRFDFLVYGQSKRLVLEYNGIFHYYIVQGKTSMYTLSKQQMNDIIKHDYCRRKQIPLLWIPYWMSTQDIRNSIQFFLLKHKLI